MKITIPFLASLFILASCKYTDIHLLDEEELGHLKKRVYSLLQ